MSLAFVFQSLQLIPRSGPIYMKPAGPDPQVSCSDLTQRYGIRMVVSVMAADQQPTWRNIPHWEFVFKIEPYVRCPHSTTIIPNTSLQSIHWFTTVGTSILSIPYWLLQTTPRPGSRCQTSTQFEIEDWVKWLPFYWQHYQTHLALHSPALGLNKKQ